MKKDIYSAMSKNRLKDGHMHKQHRQNSLHTQLHLLYNKNKNDRQQILQEQLERTYKLHKQISNRDIKCQQQQQYCNFNKTGNIKFKRYKDSLTERQYNNSSSNNLDTEINSQSSNQQLNSYINYISRKVEKRLLKNNHSHLQLQLQLNNNSSSCSSKSKNSNNKCCLQCLTRKSLETSLSRQKKLSKKISSMLVEQEQKSKIIAYGQQQHPQAKINVIKFNGIGNGGGSSLTSEQYLLNQTTTTNRSKINGNQRNNRGKEQNKENLNINISNNISKSNLNPNPNLASAYNSASNSQNICSDYKQKQGQISLQNYGKSQRQRQIERQSQSERQIQSRKSLTLRDYINSSHGVSSSSQQLSSYFQDSQTSQNNNIHHKYNNDNENENERQVQIEQYQKSQNNSAQNNTITITNLQNRKTQQNEFTLKKNKITHTATTTPKDQQVLRQVRELKDMLINILNLNLKEKTSKNWDQNVGTAENICNKFTRKKNINVSPYKKKNANAIINGKMEQQQQQYQQYSAGF